MAWEIKKDPYPSKFSEKHVLYVNGTPRAFIGVFPAEAPRIHMWATDGAVLTAKETAEIAKGLAALSKFVQTL